MPTDCDILLELCNKPVHTHTADIHTLLTYHYGVHRALSLHSRWMVAAVLSVWGPFKAVEVSFSQILIPLQSVLIPTLPSTGPANTLHHDAFPGHWAYLDGFDDTVEILASLQKPKKIGLKGSDGRSYTKDDLRKDCGLMEFNCLINKDAESRRRELHIRTYAVIIEWVNNTGGLRHILTPLYKERG